MPTSTSVRRFAGGLAATALIILGLSAAQAQAGPSSPPANKAAASGSSIEVAGPQQNKLLMSETVKTPGSGNLLLGVTLECSIVTNLVNTTDSSGTSTSSASGTIKVWLTIDGTATAGIVKVSEDDTGSEPGKVTFCDRAYRMDTAGLPQDSVIRTYLSTKSAHGFNWMATNVGAGTHTIQVWATLSQAASTDATASAVIGKRTLTVEQVKSANNEAVTCLC